MFKVKHERTADCVVAGYRVHKSGDDTIGSLLLGLCKDDGTLASVGVIGALPMAKRRQLFTELQSLVTTFDDHPWNLATHEAGERTRKTKDSATQPNSTDGAPTATQPHAPTTNWSTPSPSAWPTSFPTAPTMADSSGRAKKFKCVVDISNSPIPPVRRRIAFGTRTHSTDLHTKLT